MRPQYTFAVIVAIGLANCVAAISCRSSRDASDKPDTVGERGDGSYVVTTRQVIRPVGDVLEFNGRPVDVVMSPDGRTAYAKDLRQLLVIDVATWTLRQALAFPEKAVGTMHGIAVRPDGGAVASEAEDGTLRLWDPATGRALAPPVSVGSEDVNSVAFDRDGSVVAAAAGGRWTWALW